MLIIATFLYGLYWLWQRQPKPQEKASPPSQEAKEVRQPQAVEIIPQSFSVLSDPKTRIQGKSKPETLVAVYSNDFNYLVQTDAVGKFEQDMELTEGLNLAEIVVFDRDLREETRISTIYWLSGKEKVGNTVYAGPVKTIFDNLITVSTISGEKTVKIAQSATIELPKGEEAESTKSASENIRVGDYLIALGEIAGDNLNAQRVEVIRKNKPQVVKKVLGAKILTSVRQNLFSAKETQENKILEFVLAKNSVVEVTGRQAKAEEIVKEKTAIIFFHQEGDKRIVDLIYLLQ